MVRAPKTEQRRRRRTRHREDKSGDDGIHTVDDQRK